MAFAFEGRSSDSPFVETIWRTYTERAGSFVSSAAVQWEMVVTRYQGKTTLTIRGPETRATPAEAPADAEFFGIIFRLGTFMPHLPVRTIMDRNDMSLPEAASRSFWFHGSAWQFPDYDNADTFVNRLAHDGLLARDPVVSAALQGQPQALSPRALQYRFLRTTGLTQNTIHQIERARRANALLVQGIPILDTVYEAGYFDQAHLTRSVKRFFGQTPAQIARVKQPG